MNSSVGVMREATDPSTDRIRLDRVLQSVASPGRSALLFTLGVKSSDQTLGQVPAACCSCRRQLDARTDTYTYTYDAHTTDAYAHGNPVVELNEYNWS